MSARLFAWYYVTRHSSSHLALLRLLHFYPLSMHVLRTTDSIVPLMPLFVNSHLPHTTLSAMTYLPPSYALRPLPLSFSLGISLIIIPPLPLNRAALYV